MSFTLKAYQRKPGQWECKGVDPSTGRRKSYYGKSQAEAEAKAEQSFRSILPGDTSTLYGYYACVYLPTVAHRSDAWKEQIAWAMDGYVLPKFGDSKLTDLTRQEFQLLFNALLSKMETSSVRKIKIVLGCVMNLAEDDGALPKNPVRRVRLPMDREPEKTALTFEQLWALLESAQPRAVPVVILGGFCGLRIGEICGVSRADIAGQTLKVRHQILQGKGGCKRTPQLKTPQSKRDIPIPSSLLERLLNAGQVSGIYVTSNSTGGYLTPNNATRELAAACEKAGLGHYETRKEKKVFVPMVSPHELRHTFVSLLENEIEIPPRLVACLAGRKYDGPNAGYSHSTEAQLLRAMTRYWEQASTKVRQNICRTGEEKLG